MVVVPHLLCRATRHGWVGPVLSRSDCKLHGGSRTNTGRHYATATVDIGTLFCQNFYDALIKVYREHSLEAMWQLGFLVCSHYCNSASKTVVSFIRCKKITGSKLLQCLYCVGLGHLLFGTERAWSRFKRFDRECLSRRRSIDYLHSSGNIS